MLGQALVLTFLLLLNGHQAQDSAEPVVGLSGMQLSLQPPTTQTKHINSVKWKIQRNSTSKISVILTWKNKTKVWTNDLKEIFDFREKNLTLLIKAAQPRDSGLYLLEVTGDSGEVKHHQFQVSVFESLLPDPIGTLEAVGETKVLGGGKCQVSLSCSVSGGGNVSYVWYRGKELIETPNNLSKLEEQIDVHSLENYTCNVSNPVSWVNHTFSQSCDNKQHTFVDYLVFIVIFLIILLLVTLTCFCVWRRKRKQCHIVPGEPLTVYEDVNNLQNRCNQMQRQNPPGEGSTIYSMIQSQSSAPTSQETNTLYALIQPSRKSESKKKNQSSSFSYTIYEEVGKTQLKAQNPARLSHRELENFCIYS
ncbi:natural killer cell receptor 2B4 isoform X2 [Enhydra lutris kenyoni]|uniref:Natural killer cell receptor 2B4 isoform X2 n=1 Tax=Enhydra lutris kenyoni TaxID=391180 RepID=A0A2Y9IE79_ENHLU|nr:natural killer cell receptor 2B4 isoform X2 [Enhydra lutris kenyoni]